MWPVFVILFSPASRQLSYLLQVTVQIQAQQFIAQAMVKALHRGIPVRLAGFDIVNLDAIGTAGHRQTKDSALRSIQEKQGAVSDHYFSGLFCFSS